jgi:hypothetical protein
MLHKKVNFPLLFCHFVPQVNRRGPEQRELKSIFSCFLLKIRVSLRIYVVFQKNAARHGHARRKIFNRTTLIFTSDFPKSQ